MCSRNGMGLGAHGVMEREWGGRVCDQEVGLGSGGEGVRVRTGCSEDEDAGRERGCALLTDCLFLLPSRLLGDEPPRLPAPNPRAEASRKIQTPRSGAGSPPQPAPSRSAAAPGAATPARRSDRSPWRVRPDSLIRAHRKAGAGTRGAGDGGAARGSQAPGRRVEPPPGSLRPD